MEVPHFTKAPVLLIFTTRPLRSLVLPRRSCHEMRILLITGTRSQFLFSILAVESFRIEWSQLICPSCEFSPVALARRKRAISRTFWITVTYCPKLPHWRHVLICFWLPNEQKHFDSA